MNLEQAQHISALSTAPSDGCTWFPDLGFSRFCVMHDHLLQHFVNRTHRLNHAQLQYMAEENILGATLTRKQVDHLFREALDQKKDDSPDMMSKIWYWFWRNIYYFGVATWRRIRR